MSKKPPKKLQSKFINGIEGFFYLTERIILSPFPGEKEGQNESEEEESQDNEGGGDLIKRIAGYLNEKHPNHYLVYNLSEYKYDYADF